MRLGILQDHPETQVSGWIHGIRHSIIQEIALQTRYSYYKHQYLQYLLLK